MQVSRRVAMAMVAHASLSMSPLAWPVGAGGESGGKREKNLRERNSTYFPALAFLSPSYAPPFLSRSPRLDRGVQETIKTKDISCWFPDHRRLTAPRQGNVVNVQPPHTHARPSPYAPPTHAFLPSPLPPCPLLTFPRRGAKRPKTGEPAGYAFRLCCLCGPPDQVGGSVQKPYGEGNYRRAYTGQKFFVDFDA